MIEHPIRKPVSPPFHTDSESYIWVLPGKFVENARYRDLNKYQIALLEKILFFRVALYQMGYGIINQN
ncbi:hypothetical protein B2D07_14635 [Desulfococcus multivorans]|jgi:hypothetical protein|nr:hypothetical protein B2D07_14635 [Desulfococcus multivorans]